MANIDVIDLIGVGPAMTLRMNELGVFTTSDLLRAKRGRLAEEVQGASLAQVRRWQAIAELLEVKGVTLPVAEGLHAAGVETLDELAGRPLSGLRGLFDTMRTQGVVQVLPSDDDLVTWMKDALLLRHTGTLNGTVIGADRSPLVGVTASCMGQRAESDARGRFRLRRLPLGRRLLVYLEHPAYAPKTVKTGPVAPAGLLVGERFKLTRKRAATAPRVLSELQGDKLPALSSAPIRTRAQDGAPSPLDILRVVELLVSGDVRVISRLFDYDGAGFVVRSYRFERSDLPTDIQVSDHMRYQADRWQVVKMTPATIERHRRWLRERRRLPKPPANASAADVQRFVEEWLRLHARG